MVRSLAWAMAWTYFHPELRTPSLWGSDPSQIAMSLLLYIVSGVLVELFYNYLMSGEFTLIPSQRPKRPVSTQENPWRLFIEARPPVNVVVEIFCADESVRSGKIISQSDGNLVFEIDYEEDVQANRLENPMEYCPLYWRHPIKH